MVSSVEAVKGRRQEHAESTRQALVDSATELFEERGYAGASIEDITARARVTRGALYHHFRSKQELFEAAFDDLAAELAGRVMLTAAAAPDPWSQLVTGIDAFLDAGLEPRYRRIALQEGPAALGWTRWRDINERHILAILHLTLETVVATGRIRSQRTEMLTRVLFAAMCEAARLVAEAEDQASARRDASELLRSLLGG